MAATARAQRGDRKGEVQSARLPAEKIPPAPPLAPADALKTFRLAPGFRIEIAAHETLVQTPVALQFDADGRMWVLEMRGYMPNVDGAGEDQPTGRISILEDANHDGRADRSIVFLDGLVMPRAFLLVRGGLLVAEPPSLWFYPSEDDKPGERALVDAEYAPEAAARRGARANPEHSANSLTLALDNWIYSLYHNWRYRYANGRWLREPVPKRTQWGMSQDNYGRLFYTSNGDHLRGDLLPPHYASRHGINAKMPGVNVRIAGDQSVWPVRVNPGVNRGYQTGTLREDGTLARFTAACGTSIYRGDQFPPEFVGNAFTPEPAANLVRRNILSETNGIVTARNAYDRAEFLASTDELFRPVNTCTGPGGTLYIVDMYHGIIQHRMFLTSYLRQQAESRGLDKVTGYGRIYRVVHENGKETASPLSKASTTELVQTLAHPNGWRRDTAQRLLIERADAVATAPLKALACEAEDSLARLHALWTLEGLGALDEVTVRNGLGDAHPKVRAAAIRLSETFMTDSENPLRGRIVKMTDDPAAEVQAQLALTLGGLAANEARPALETLAKSEFALVREAANYALASATPLPQPEAALSSGAPPLSAADQKQFENGRDTYNATCVACHQPHGMGLEGLAPPLVGSEWIASEERLVRIVLHGVRGPIKVKEQLYEADMPALGILDDTQIADVLTYVRREWGHAFEPVTAATVKRIRDLTSEREDAWTAEELSKFK